MAYSSKSDAISKLTSGRDDNNSVSIYYSDNNHNLNTIYYVNSTKTSLLPAGNYVLPTNYRTLWLVIGSNGKLTQLAEYLFSSAPDTSFVDESLFSKQTNTRISDYSESKLTLTDSILTDTAWEQNSPSGKPKQWVVGASDRKTTPLSNIDISAMAGYDLMMYIGGYGPWGIFDDFAANTAFVHVKQDINKPTIFSEGVYTKMYFFKPDYWYARQDINCPTFFKRNLFLDNFIKNKRGLTKLSTGSDRYIHDIVQHNKTTVRTSTRKQRGLNLELYQSDPALYNTTQNISRGYLLGNYANADYATSKNEGYWFDQPLLLSGTVFGNAWGHGFNPNIESHQIKLVATWQSIALGDFTGSYTHNGTTINFAQANPYQWTTTGFNNPATSEMRDALIDSPIEWFWDMEWYWYLMEDSIALDGVFKCYKYAKDYVTSNNLAVRNTRINWYSGSVYRSDGHFLDSGGSAPTVNNYTSNPYYLDYHNYYVNNADKSTLSSVFRPIFYNYAELFHQFSISNYHNDYGSTDYFYKLVHQYDIGNKLVTEKLGSNHNIMFTSLMFSVYETVAGSNMQAKRKAIGPDGQPGSAKPDISPDFWQSLAAWSFGYGDGCFIWDVGKFRVEDYADYVWDATNGSNPSEIFKNDFAGADWYFATIANLYQNKDIIEANTNWSYISQDKGGGQYTTGTENYPFVNYVFKRPLVVAKFSIDGKEALILSINPFNNGYTKTTTNIMLTPNNPISIDMWGTYTTILRVKINN
jgi:hypothetical protein